jgi:hypothetical protein
MTIEKGSQNAAIHHPRKGLMMVLRGELRHDFA